MTWKDNEREIADQVLRNLQSEKYKSKNYLFLQPFDLSQVPGYLDIIAKPLDLQTVSNQLNSGYYDSAPAGAATAFWNDVNAIFENAILYHSDKPTKWISKMARDMLKVVSKEKKNAKKPKGETDPAKSTKKKIKLPAKSLAAQTVAAATANANAAPGASASASTPVKQEGAPTSPATASSQTKKPKSVKIKLSSTGTAAGTASVGGSGSSSSTTKPTAVKAKPTQPKIRLTLKTKLAAATPASNASTKTTTPSGGNARPSKPKISLKVGGGGPSRGKELPKAVADQQQAEATSKGTAPAKPASTAKSTTSKTTTKKKSKKAKSTSTTPPHSTTPTTSTPRSAATLTLAQRQQCSKVLAGLRRRQQKHIAWFLNPIKEKEAPEYRAKIKHPMDISTAQSKLEKGTYKHVKDFVLDIRRIFANCLRYNTSMKDILRPVAVEVLQTAEQLFKVMLLPANAVAGAAPPPFPPLIFCWKLCIDILDTLYNLVNPADAQPTALYFLHPVSFYCGGSFPSDYLEKIPKPMDFGTVTANLLEGRYQTVDSFANDCRLVISNCHEYYKGREDGKIYVEQASRLNEYLSRQLDQLARYVKTSKGASDRLRSVQPEMLPRPPPALLMSVLEELRALKYTDKATKITEAAMGPFEKPVSTAVFTDYTQFVQEPMDLQSVERKTQANLYVTPEDFEYDINLIFKNCEVYNAQRGGDHLVAMAKYGARQFRRIFYAKMRAFEDPSTVEPPIKVESAPTEPPTTKSDGPPPAKKIKINTAGLMRGKSAPRISITATNIATAASQELIRATSKSPKTVGGAVSSQKKSTGTPKADQPVPLHIAIARVKEAFPLRRAVKSLQPWEADCARYFKELMRHPWISAARPKFIFHVPVPILFPELKDAYAQKIRKPMDLTTVECTLLAGNRYTSPEDFISDIALVFSNAIRFNKAGREIGDPLSCAYYDASVHLLKYSRWLSLELLSAHVDGKSDHTDEPSPDGLPPFHWKLTAGNRKKAREEMEALVLKEPIEKSLEGDRYTWHEAECERVLKALRHQSDLRHMTFFIQPNYPADYTAFIAKPMDWERVQRTLKKRHYDTVLDVISDLRLIFSNALKYNARLKGTDTVSGRAYESAVYMSNKLEAAINKLLLSVADRLERERIDHANAEREIEAHEHAEEEKIRAAWKNRASSDGTLSPPSQNDVAQKIRLVRRAAQRRDATDFEKPFFEEDEGQHESSYFEVVKLQKSMYEKQTQELIKMRAATNRAGANLFAMMLQREMALAWLGNEAKNDAESIQGVASGGQGSGELERSDEGETAVKGTAVLSELEKEDRQRVQLKLVAPMAAKAKKRKRPFLKFE